MSVTRAARRAQDGGFAFAVRALMMPFAAGSADPLCKAAAAAGRALIISSTGSRQPITPVDIGRMAVPPASKPSAAAAAAHTCSDASTPPAAHTFDILLFTTTACSGAPAASRARPTFTGAPGKRLRVKTAAYSVVGSSSAITVRFIVALAEASSSAGEKVKPEVPTRKPRGRGAVASVCRYEASSAWQHAVTCARPRACRPPRAAPTSEAPSAAGTESKSSVRIAI